MLYPMSRIRLVINKGLSSALSQPSLHAGILPTVATTLVTTFACLAIVGSGAQAAEPTDTESSVERLSVIGSRLAVRSATDTMAPLDIISQQQLADTGVLETAKALQLLIPSFNFPTSSVTDGSDAVRPASLRGLSPDHTLVLLNGKRRHGTALVHLNGTMGKGSSNVDLNTIPIAAIKRIEILRDGAAAQYGSDAIAGVINIVLKDAEQGGELQTLVGQTFEGDGEQVKASINSGFALGNAGFLQLTLEQQQKQGTNRAGLDPREQYNRVGGQLDPREATFNRLNHKVGDAAYQHTAVLANTAYQWQQLQGYGFAAISSRDTQSHAFYRIAKDARNIPEVYPDGFLPQLAPQSDDYSYVVGLRSDAMLWQWDMALSQGQSHYAYFVNDSINASVGPASPTSAFAGRLSNGERALSFDMSRAFDLWQQTPLELAFGGSYRQQQYQIRQGDELSWRNFGYQNKAGGIQGFGGFTPESEVDAKRAQRGVYADMEHQLSTVLSWGAALRYEYYDGFGSHQSYKVAARYDISDTMALRLTRNDGFRAPSVQQLYFSNLSTLFVADPKTGVLQPTESGTFNNIDVVTRALGQGDLQPERSDSFSGGITYNADDGLTFTLDTYRIAIEDRIILTGNVTRADSASLAQLLGNSGANSVRFFTNAVDTTTTGVEAVSTYRFTPTTWGDWKASLSLQYNKNAIDAIKVPPLLDALQLKLFDAVEQVRITKANPRRAAVFSLQHDIGAWQHQLRANYFGAYTIGFATGDKTFAAKTIVDISSRYQWSDRLALSIGVSNLLDTYPEPQPTINSFNGIFKYPNTNAPFGFNGGSFYAEARWSF